MAWIESHQVLREHPKTAKLRRRLGVSLPQAVGHLHLLWWWCLDYAANGDLSRFDADVIADAAGWEDDAGMFIRALISSGFVDEDMMVHDWDDYAGRLIERREANAKRMRDARQARRSSNTDTTPFETRAENTGDARATHVRGLPDPTGPDLNRTQPDPSPPTPPPQAERGAGRRRRSGSVETDEVAAVVPSLVPLSADELAALERALEQLRGEMSEWNYRQYVEPLVPLGRSADGAWYLSAQVGGAAAVRARPLLAQALFADDAEGARMLTIVEA